MLIRLLLHQRNSLNLLRPKSPTSETLPTEPDLTLPPTADVLYLAKQELIAKFEIARSQLASDIKGIEEEHQQETVFIQGLPLLTPIPHPYLNQ